MMTNLNELQFFVQVSETQSFTKAAKRLGVPKSSVSRAILKLENRLGVRLVERTTRRVALTEAGELLVVRARRILAELDAAGADLRALTGIQTGHVLIGAIHTMGPVDLSLALGSFHERHPGVELTVREESSEELAELLRADELDLAFLSVTERIESRGIGFQPLVSEELVAIVPRSHRLGGRRRVRMRELAGERFIAYREGARLRELLISAGHAAGFEPQIALESNESQLIRRLVARGLGVALVPRSDCGSENEELSVAKLIDPPLKRDITLAWREGRRHPPATAAFLELCLATYAAGAQDATE
ncbi:MAG TPA: LysR family transcriptional regulator [Steroidobacteraceae bacterium]|nr:LysR family transcriptional regulator [Steroidobacteraceae bacterium]